MLRLPSFAGSISPGAYAIAAPTLLLSQHALVALAYKTGGERLNADAEFWLFPLRRLALLPGVTLWAALLAFAFSLAILWLLALISFRRAGWSGMAYSLAAFSVVPLLQLGAVAMLALLPRRSKAERAEEEAGRSTVYAVQGLLAGVALIVLAVLVSAVTFGAYGWGLFVMTPFLVGVATAYLANRRVPLEAGRTMLLVVAALGLGGVALMSFALEGLVCIVMAAPLAVPVALAGGALGRALANIGHDRGKPLLCVGLLPAVFALEAAMPPEIELASVETVEISAPPGAVWQVLTSEDPITAPPGLVGRVGLAYPLRSQIVGAGVGAERLGYFSTGAARERITEWLPGRRLSFSVLSQPPAMEEMSPYRRVHAPHVIGYFDTAETAFELAPLPNGGTRLTVRASHELRIDPVLYWEPLARWAIRSNSLRVLVDIAARAEALD